MSIANGVIKVHTRVKTTAMWFFILFKSIEVCNFLKIALYLSLLIYIDIVNERVTAMRPAHFL